MSGGVLFPSSPRGREELLALLIKIPAQATRAPPREHQERPGACREGLNPKCSQNFLQFSHRCTLGRPWAAIKLFTPPPPTPTPQFLVSDMYYMGQRGGRGAFSRKWGCSGGWHPRTGSTKTGVLSEPAGKALTFHVLDVDTPPPWPPFGPKLCHFKVTSKFSLN